MAVQIIVDSTADFSAKEIEKRQITCIPMTVTFGNEQYIDGVDLTKEEFFVKLMNEKEFPKTSQPSPAKFAECFEEAKENGDDVVAILVSGALSGTVQSATIAKDIAEHEGVYIVDSNTVTLGIRLLVDHAVRMRDQGKGAAEIVERLEELKDRVRIYAGLDTLEYLQKGGRISKAAASLGRLAGIKPIITIDEEGKVAVCGKQRGNKNVFRQIIKYIDAEMPDENYSVYFLYSADKKNCISFIQTLQKNGLDFGKIKTREIGPTVGSHIGPGGFGIVYVANK